MNAQWHTEFERFRNLQHRLRYALLWTYVVTPIVCLGIGQLEPAIGFVLGAASGIGGISYAIVQANRLHRAACPFCGQTFFCRGIMHNAFLTRCAHCAVRLDTDDPVLP
jgi:hypothetical protein